MEVKNIAELSLSAEGDKQDASIVCFKIKNFEDIKSEIEGTTNENIQRIVEESERKKAYIYQNEGNIFFIFAPLMTRTYKNEKSAVELAQKIKEILTHHNKMYRQKIEFGISLDYGPIVAKGEKNGILKFISIGPIMNISKKIASASEGDILLSEKMKERTMAEIKTEKYKSENVEAYVIKEIRHKDEHKRFLSEFVRRNK